LIKIFKLNYKNALNNYKEDVDEYTLELQKYGAVVGVYQTDVNAVIQKWTAEEWTQKFQKYEADYTALLQEYSSDMHFFFNGMF